MTSTAMQSRQPTADTNTAVTVPCALEGCAQRYHFEHKPVFAQYFFNIFYISHLSPPTQLLLEV